MTNKNEKFVHFTWRFYLITPSENLKKSHLSRNGVEKCDYLLSKTFIQNKTTILTI